MADTVAITTTGRSPEQVAVDWCKSSGLSSLKKVVRRIAWLETKRVRKKVDPKSVKIRPLRHKSLPDDLVARIRLIRAALLGVYTHSMQFWIDGFRGDAHPSKEVLVWEHIAACYIEYATMNTLTVNEHRAAFHVLYAMSAGASDEEATRQAHPLTPEAVGILRRLFSHNVPPYDMKDDPFPNAYEADDEQLATIEADDKELFPFDIPDHLLRDAVRSMSRPPSRKRIKSAAAKKR